VAHWKGDRAENPVIVMESSGIPPMRSIETAMNEAIRYEKDWRKDNTSVEVIHHGVSGTFSYEKEIVVKLHGNKIARIFPISRRAVLSSCGWTTNTTKSRINAILSGLNYRQGSLYQEKYHWYIGERDFRDNMEVSY
jgi:hypothetical protein